MFWMLGSFWNKFGRKKRIQTVTLLHNVSRWINSSLALQIWQVDPESTTNTPCVPFKAKQWLLDSAFPLQFCLLVHILFAFQFPTIFTDVNLAYHCLLSSEPNPHLLTFTVFHIPLIIYFQQPSWRGPFRLLPLEQLTTRKHHFHFLNMGIHVFLRE